MIFFFCKKSKETTNNLVHKKVTRSSLVISQLNNIYFLTMVKSYLR